MSYFGIFFFLQLAAITINILQLQGVIRARGSCIPVPEEASILMEIKNAVLHDSSSFSSWQYAGSNQSCSQMINSSSSSSSSCTSSTAPLQSWSGVSCGRRHGRVTELLLPSMALQGAIPGSWIGQLRFLRTLNLSSNNFTGGLPSQLANCTHLQTLDLSQNNLNGSIPSEWGTLRSLQLLALWMNALTGKIPAALANCSSLVEISCQINYLSGNIPLKLGVLNTLQVLFLWNNTLTGNIPATLGNCTALARLSLGNNQLSKTIPKELGMLNQLWYLDLIVNNLTGEIPATLANCSGLQKLGLYNNLLSGNIPSQFGMLNSLSHVTVADNTLTGNLPGAVLANWTALQFLDLYGNRFSGTLAVLNELSGNPNRTALYSLQVGVNNFHGEVPDVFDRFTNLQALDMSQNSLSGTLPRSLGSLKALTYLYLDTNMFRGSIPNVFLTSLQLLSLDLSFNDLSGAIPASLGGFPALLALKLSNNFLTGAIPPELGSLFQLQKLEISNNNLTGDIPPSLSKCVELTTLSLSSNHLSGNLPPSLGNLEKLRVLNLSYNEFKGLVPNLAPFNNTHVTDLTGNIRLCGVIVNRICDDSTNSPYEILSHRHSHGKTIINICIAVGVGVVVLGAILLVLAAFHRYRKHQAKLRAPTMLNLRLIKFRAAELREATGCFSEANVLGRGSVGTVYRATLAGGEEMAVKLLNNDMAIADEATFRREVAILAKVRHRNILRVWGCCFNLDMKAIILELMPNGSLDKYLNHGAAGGGLAEMLSAQQKLTILQGVAQGLEYLHHRHPDGCIVHCDIKPENILLDADLEAHIADFGIAKLLKGGSVQESASILLRGSVGYIAPEYGYQPNPSTKGDVYSFGVVMLEVLTGKRQTSSEILEEGHTFLSWMRSIHPHKIHSTLGLSRDDVASQLFRLALLCTQDSPNDRPTMCDICYIFQCL